MSARLTSDVVMGIRALLPNTSPRCGDAIESTEDLASTVQQQIRPPAEA
jgi:hypothetical protein